MWKDVGQCISFESFVITSSLLFFAFDIASVTWARMWKGCRAVCRLLGMHRNETGGRESVSPAHFLLSDLITLRVRRRLCLGGRGVDLACSRKLHRPRPGSPYSPGGESRSCFERGVRGEIRSSSLRSKVTGHLRWWNRTELGGRNSTNMPEDSRNSGPRAKFSHQHPINCIWRDDRIALLARPFHTWNKWICIQPYI